MKPDLSTIPATKSDIAVLYAILASFAEKVTGKRPVVHIPDHGVPVPVIPCPTDVRWSDPGA